MRSVAANRAEREEDAVTAAGFDLSGRVALVTGGTRGLGRAIALGLADAGADVIVSSRKPEACEQVAREIRERGRQSLAHPCHVGHWQELDRLVEAAYERFGRVDVLVNNAGVSPLYSRPEEISEELWDKVQAVNLKGPFRADAGADVIVSSRKPDACEHVAQEIRERGRQSLAHPCHVGRWEELDRLVDAAYERFGRVDVLVNNAGISPLYSRPEEITEELGTRSRR